MTLIPRKIKNIKSLLVLFYVFFPYIIIAGGPTTPRDFKTLGNNIILVLKSFVNLAMGAALVLFLFGIVKYLSQYDNEKAKSESVQTITWGLIGLFVMAGIWGILKLTSQSLLRGSGFGVPYF